MAKKISPVNINEGIIMGDMKTIINNMQESENAKLKKCIEIILSDYLPASAMNEAQMALTTEQLQLQIAAFCGTEFPISEIFTEMTAQGFVAKFGDSIELGIPKNFYWLFSKK